MTTKTFGNIQQELSGFFGTENYYKRSVLGVSTGMVYTDGVKHFCSIAEAQWFIDVVNSYMTNVKKVKDDYFFIVRVAVNRKAQATFTIKREVNEEEVVVIKQEIPYTDLPEGEYKFYLIHDEYRNEYVLMLTGEY